jgi:hypothetical protein
MSKKKLTKSKLYFDREGNLYIPNDIKFAGEINPPLKAKEWWLLVLESSDKSQMAEGKYKELVKNLIGSKQVEYRVRKSLKEKKYL